MKTELERLKVLSALKLGYGKLTAKNTTESEFKNIEDAMEIVKNCSIQNVSNNEVAVCGKCKGRLENHLDYLHCTNCDLWYEPQTDC